MALTVAPIHNKRGILAGVNNAWSLPGARMSDPVTRFGMG